MTRRLEDVKLGSTESLCPHCLTRIPAGRFARGNAVYMGKTCPDHGDFEVVLWRGSPEYETWVRAKKPSFPSNPSTSVSAGCPFDCGLCPDHRQQTCTALLEVTHRCNLNCRFCFADSGKQAGPDPGMDTIRKWYETVQAGASTANIQLSGGEPTIRDDLPEIVELGRKIGFPFIQVNTNGLRLAGDDKFLEKLVEAGVSSAFLQFDGLHEEIHYRLRGAYLLEQKLAAIENCRKHGIGVVLVPTVVPGVNAHNLGDMVRFALENLDVIVGVHFQPVSYFGRFPTAPHDESRITLPEIMSLLQIQTDGLVKADDFKPPGCENALCSFSGSFVLMPDGLKPLTSRNSCGCNDCSPDPAEGSSQARKFVARNWSKREKKTTQESRSSDSFGDWDLLLERIATHRLSISGMAFQDVWNIDLERLKDCCIHVVSPAGKMIPFCAYNLTDSRGRSLYGRK